jgi:hypothetical protein
VREDALRQLRLLAPAIRRPQHGAQRQPAEPVPAALVTEHIAPAAGTRAATFSVAPVRDRSSARNNDRTWTSRHACFERNERVIDDDSPRTLADAMKNASDDLRVAHAVDSRHSKADGCG